MNLSILKYFLISLSLLFALSACIKDMEIDIQDINNEIVVSCLFNPNHNWELSLAKTKTINENEDRYIENASVEISSESGETFRLNYSGEMGKYMYNKRPVAGETYHLKINVPGHDVITGQSMVPNFVQASVPDVEIKWIKYLYPNNLLDYDVFPITVRFKETIKDARFMFRARTFDKLEGYKRYMLTSESLAKLKAEGLPDFYVAKLGKMADKWYLSKWDFTIVLYHEKDYEMSAYFYARLQQEAKEKTVTEREEIAFRPGICFENDTWLSNISYDVHTVFGKGQNIDQAALLYAEANLKHRMEQGNPSNLEFWLEVTHGSEDYIDYYQSYILQVSQRINPYSEPVMVHSNIKNATGIFAGYSRQMIHLFTY